MTQGSETDLCLDNVGRNLPVFLGIQTDSKGQIFKKAKEGGANA